jgi:beta-lactamase superfamily II metal-dependent hydrolase
MAATGFEVDMLSLGDADSNLVTAWNGPVDPYFILIDGGKAGHAKQVRALLAKRNIRHIHSVVCTHLHDDHAGGLVQLLGDPSLSFGQVAYHDPRDYVSETDIKDALRKSAGSTEAAVIKDSLQTVQELSLVLRRRAIPRVAPFQGQFVDFLQVLSPSPSFYSELVEEFGDADKILEVSEIYKTAPLRLTGHLMDGLLESSTLDEQPVTSPVNESSMVLGVRILGSSYLFSSDAGVRALNEVAQFCRSNAQGITWMQIPHHGSRNNLNPKLIEYFHPSTAFVSAKGGDGHPSVAVVNAFKKVGTEVYSTAYPNPLSLWRREGQVPARPDYSSAIRLWDAPADLARRRAASIT